jgi:hypothetical protein
MRQVRIGQQRPAVSSRAVVAGGERPWETTTAGPDDLRLEHREIIEVMLLPPFLDWHGWQSKS